MSEPIEFCGELLDADEIRRLRPIELYARQRAILGGTSKMVIASGGRHYGHTLTLKILSKLLEQIHADNPCHDAICLLSSNCATGLLFLGCPVFDLRLEGAK